jgi:hypothetical protein
MMVEMNAKRKEIRGLMYIRKRSGERTQHWGRPRRRGRGEEESCSEQ